MGSKIRKKYIAGGDPALLERIGAEGRAAFYEGEAARGIVGDPDLLRRARLPLRASGA